jgi:hypothetical protein
MNTFKHKLKTRNQSKDITNRFLGIIQFICSKFGFRLDDDIAEQDEEYSDEYLRCIRQCGKLLNRGVK